MVTFDDNIFDLVLVKLMWDGAVDGLATHGEVGVTRCLGLINDPTLPEDSVLNILFIVNRMIKIEEFYKLFLSLLIKIYISI